MPELDYLMCVAIAVYTVAFGVIIFKKLKLRWKAKKLRLVPTIELMGNFYQTIKIKDFIMLSMKYTFKATVTLTPQDSHGRPAPVEAGSVSVTSSDEQVARVEMNPENELEFTVFGVNPGVAQIDFSADADLGEGVVTITGFFGSEILPEMASGFGVAIGEPVEQ